MSRCRYHILNNHYLSWPGIHHGWRKDGHDSSIWIQDARLQHSGVLLHPPVQRHVVVLGPASQRVEEQDRPAVAALEETLVGVLHQKSVAVVDRVAELEGKDGILKKKKPEDGWEGFVWLWPNTAEHICTTQTKGHSVPRDNQAAQCPTTETTRSQVKTCLGMGASWTQVQFIWGPLWMRITVERKIMALFINDMSSLSRSHRLDADPCQRWISVSHATMP